MCVLKDWQELWLDEGFWHILFSFILLVIIILWRPSKNSQRFAFTPLLDNEEDADEEDDIENQQETEIFGKFLGNFNKIFIKDKIIYLKRFRKNASKDAQER